MLYLKCQGERAFKKRTLENLKEKSTLEKSRGILKTTKGKKAT